VLVLQDIFYALREFNCVFHSMVSQLSPLCIVVAP
jgi:hypothetical protein